jgi:phosphoribosylglycinamide formyltransferase-1
MAKLKVGVLISGRGSNLQALINICQAPDFPAEISLVLSNIAGVMGLERASQVGIPTATIDHTEFESREEFDSEMSRVLAENGVEFIFLAGFMRLLSDSFVKRWYDRLVNIHPSLLPAFKGLNVHSRVIQEGARFSGCTVHFVRPALDQGPIIIQACVPVRQDDTPDTLARKILKQEHIIYPLALELIANRQVKVAGERAIVDDPVYPKMPLVNPAR